MSFLSRALIALTLGLIATAAGADDLTTSSGKKLSGKLVAIDAQGVSFSTGDAKVDVSGKDIVLIDLGHKIAAPAKDAKFHEIELTDGSVFRVAKYAVKGRKIETELATIPGGIVPPTFDLPLSAVFSVMRGADDPKNREPWKKVISNRGKRDLYVERTADGLNFIQGTILSGSDDGKTFEFELEGGKKADPPLLQRSATGGLVFAQPTPAQVPPTVCKVIDVFGNELVAQSVQLSVNGVTVTTVGGVIVKYPATTGIARFDYARGNIAYLSDIEPKIDAPALPPEEKRLNLEQPFFKDRLPAGDPLKLGNDTFQKGLVVAADTALTFNIGGDYREFKALLGMPENSPDANLEAKVTIEADGRIVFTDTIKRKDKAKPIGLDMKGVKQLRVIVEADLAVNGNRVILADARVEK
jgi:NPCBM/NEW2 domain